MFQELKFQLSTAILTILTLAAGVSAFINFQQQYKFRLPEDNVVWVEGGGHVEALYGKPRRGARCHADRRRAASGPCAGVSVPGRVGLPGDRTFRLFPARERA